MQTDRLVDSTGRALHHLGDWLYITALPASLWIIGGTLLAKFVDWVLERFETRVTAHSTTGDALVMAENAKYLRAMLQVVRWTLISLIALIVAVRVLTMLGVPVAGLVGPGALLGAALGFGAQRIVQDLMAGFFVVTEKQYGYGDLVCLVLPSAVQKEGHVEDVSLRVTRLRTIDGELITVPNGQVIAAINQSKDWARAVVDVDFAAHVDLRVVNSKLADIGESFRKDKDYGPLLLDAPVPLGVIEMGADTYTIRIVARTLPGKQFEVSRDLRIFLIEALRQAGIDVRSGYNPDTPEDEE
ncbi:MAG TPA: mechanosensitive ion channel family protein [Gordonia sp. (in: high G+C Gram-positive bacteria)]|uniref:mechanosensitive ion channel family protein n=1 Tax=unclassified Gordonia (in: high G+C Gram-positive bacteria) TaxID=2657482 RepID=UPI000FB79D7E|nr:MULTISPECIES: mechanosensitive ion channel family protein [unclassified Gordonia (in: high G+C Gram-positive bacteria)]RTL08801.1 MAG: mechanosensitive ion channel family protein [Acidimicrobiia bacterium]HNP57994.1 mechanosensitive ion channel family protein [Gordonia sp. (in: high G+C Gram-positive bacteria)]HRC49742.1 mechanosensitive ion channel family protein [Gordonia sp. (in: high G+C Gram-positive bacteria)]